MPWYERSTKTQEEFARRLWRQWLIAVPFALGLPALPICLEAWHAGGHAPIGRLLASLLWVLVPGEAGLFGLALWNWRCPACRAFLGKDTHPRVCAQCGAELCREDEEELPRNPFWTLLHLSLRALRGAHDVLHGLTFMVFGACLGGIAGVWLGEHLAPKDTTALMIWGAASGLISGGVIAVGALRPRR